MSTKLQTESLKLNLESEIRQTVSANGRHDDEKTTTGSATDDYDERVSLLRAAFLQLAGAWGPGDGQRFPWVFRELDAIDRELDVMTLDDLRRRLKGLYKRLAYAKGRRGRSSTSTLAAPPVATETTGTNTNTNANAHTNAQGGNTMPIMIEVPKEVLVARGEHRAKIAAISEPQVSKFDESKQSVKLTFEITSGKYKGERLTKHYTFALGSKAALGILYRRLLGDAKAGSQVDLEKLLGCPCSVVVTHKDGDDGPYATIQDVFAIGDEEDPTA